MSLLPWVSNLPKYHKLSLSSLFCSISRGPNILIPAVDFILSFQLQFHRSEGSAATSPPLRSTNAEYPSYLSREICCNMDSDSKPKSKLAALAAARRKKENQKGENDEKHVDSSAAMLNRLIKTPTTKVPDQAPLSQSKQEENPNRASRRTYPIRTRQQKDQQRDQLAEETHIIENEDSSSPPPSSTAANQTLAAVPSSNNTPPSPFLQTPPAVASPSHFASMLFTTGPASNPENPLISPNLHFFPAYGQNFTKFDAFAGPSPDDVVLKAQSSKGSTRSRG